MVRLTPQETKIKYMISYIFNFEEVNRVKIDSENKKLVESLKMFFRTEKKIRQTDIENLVCGKGEETYN